MADFDATRVADARQAALDYLNDTRLPLPRAHDLAVVIEHDRAAALALCVLLRSLRARIVDTRSDDALANVYNAELLAQIDMALARWPST